MTEHSTDPKPYEDKPIALGVILKATLVLFLVAGFVHVLMWAQFKAMDDQKKRVDPRVSPLQPKRQIPTGPHLEAQRPAMAGADQEPFAPSVVFDPHSQERNLLESYAWVDEKNGVVRIPIREAMKKIVEKEAKK